MKVVCINKITTIWIHFDQILNYRSFRNCTKCIWKVLYSITDCTLEIFFYVGIYKTAAH